MKTVSRSKSLPPIADRKHHRDDRPCVLCDPDSGQQLLNLNDPITQKATNKFFRMANA